MKPGIHGIHHTAILTDDYDRSLRFYAEVFGFPTRLTWRADDHPDVGRGAYLDAGNGTHVELLELRHATDRAEPALTWRTSGRLSHLCIAVDSVDDVCERARAFGARIAQEPAAFDLPNVTGIGTLTVRVGFIEGPGGELLEINSGLPDYLIL